MKTHTVTGGGGIKLHAREWGKANGPAILFIHGWSQCYLCWQKQYESALAENFRLAAFDLRGHGMSEAPEGSANYTTAELWADDVAAVIETLGLDNPILVGWSYGGFVICDYLRAHGEGDIAGINFVSSAVRLDTAAFGSLIGPGFLDYVPGATSADLGANIEAVRDFLKGCTAKPMAQEDYETALAWNMAVRPDVRGALVSRMINSDAVLSELRKPVLVSHGASDTVVLPAMGKHIIDTCTNPTASWYNDTGHAPFMEEAGRFNSELANFVKRTTRPLVAAE